MDAVADLVLSLALLALLALRLFTARSLFFDSLPPLLLILGTQ
jgi:hypothetical protein